MSSVLPCFAQMFEDLPRRGIDCAAFERGLQVGPYRTVEVFAVRGITAIENHGGVVYQ